MKKLLLIILAIASLTANTNIDVDIGMVEGKNYICTTTVEGDVFRLRLITIGRDTMILGKDVVLTYVKNAKIFKGIGNNGEVVLVRVYPKLYKFKLINFDVYFKCKVEKQTISKGK